MNSFQRWGGGGKGEGRLEVLSKVTPFHITSMHQFAALAILNRRMIAMTFYRAEHSQKFYVRRPIESVLYSIKSNFHKVKSSKSKCTLIRL